MIKLFRIGSIRLFFLEIKNNSTELVDDLSITNAYKKLSSTSSSKSDDTKSIKTLLSLIIFSFNLFSLKNFLICSS
jgi:hypothetical protein